jgi:hypothetical protein
MKLFAFTVFCLVGCIYEPDQYTSTDILQNGYYDLEYPNGVYLYVTKQRDSVWFIIEDEFIYEAGDSSKFQIQR